MLIVATQQ